MHKPKSLIILLLKNKMLMGEQRPNFYPKINLYRQINGQISVWWEQMEELKIIMSGGWIKYKTTKKYLFIFSNVGTEFIYTIKNLEDNMGVFITATFDRGFSKQVNYLLINITWYKHFRYYIKCLRQVMLTFPPENKRKLFQLIQNYLFLHVNQDAIKIRF